MDEPNHRVTPDFVTRSTPLFVSRNRTRRCVTLPRFRGLQKRTRDTCVAVLQTTTVAINFLAWLGARGIEPGEVTQAEIDSWHADGPATRRPGRHLPVLGQVPPALSADSTFRDTIAATARSFGVTRASKQSDTCCSTSRCCCRIGSPPA